MTNTIESLERAITGTLNMRTRFVTHTYDEAERTHCFFVHRKSRRSSRDGEILFVVYYTDGDLRVERWRETSFLDDICMDNLICTR